MAELRTPDQLVATIARIARAIAEREAERAKMTPVDRSKRGGSAA